LPSLSAHASLNEVEEFRRKIALGLRLLFFVVLLSASFLVLLRTEAIRLLLQSGRFSAFDTNETAMALLFFSPTVVFTSLQQLVVRAFYALQKPSIPVTTGAFSVLLCIALSLLFTSSMKLSGLTLANSLSAAINCCLLIFLLVRHFGGLELRLAFRSVITSLLSLLPSALVTIFCSRWCHANLLDNGKVAQALQLFIPLIFGSIAYLLAAYILRHPELAYLLRFLHRRKAYAR
jgi:putative peptidoglycan lipid II flippase